MPEPVPASITTQPGSSSSCRQIHADVGLVLRTARRCETDAVHHGARPQQVDEALPVVGEQLAAEAAADHRRGGEGAEPRSTSAGRHRQRDRRRCSQRLVHEDRPPGLMTSRKRKKGRAAAVVELEAAMLDVRTAWAASTWAWACPRCEMRAVKSLIGRFSPPTSSPRRSRNSELAPNTTCRRSPSAAPRGLVELSPGAPHAAMRLLGSRVRELDLPDELLLRPLLRSSPPPPPLSARGTASTR